MTTLLTIIGWILWIAMALLVLAMTIYLLSPRRKRLLESRQALPESARSIVRNRDLYFILACYWVILAGLLLTDYSKLHLLWLFFVPSLLISFLKMPGILKRRLSERRESLREEMREEGTLGEGEKNEEKESSGP